MNAVDWLLNLDHKLFLWINGFNEIPWLNYVLGWPTLLGQLEFLLAVVFCVMSIFRLTEWAKKYIAFALIAAIVNLFVVGLKLVFIRPRPFAFFPPEALVRVLFVQPDTYSFPSGHAAVAFAAAVVLHFMYGKPARFVYILAVIVAISRIFVGVHYPSDVIAGAWVGISGGWIGIKVLKRLEETLSKN